MNPLQLEIFDLPEVGPGDPGVVDAPILLTAATVADLQQSSFDAGYQQGLGAAATTQEAHDTELRATIARKVQEFAFDYHDARAHVLRNLHPLIREITTHLLPQLSEAALPQLVAEACLPLAEAVSEASIRIHAHPTDCVAVDAALADCVSLPIDVVADDTLGPAQVRLQAGARETWVDPNSAREAIAAALLACFSPAHEDISHD